MNQVQSPFAQPAEYFTNGGQGYDHPQVFSFPECNVNVNCYFKELTAEQLEKVKKGVEYFILKNPDPDIQFENLKIFYLYIFEDIEEFRQVGRIGDTLGAGYLFRIGEHPIEQDPLALSKEYFGNQGDEKCFEVSPPDCNIKVKCCYNTASKEQLKEITNNILAIFKNFLKEFPKTKNIDEELKTFKINIFNNMEDYNSLGSKISNCNLIGTRGITFKEGVQQVMYINDPSDLRVLRHELAHALTYYVTKGIPFRAPRFIIEGIAEYFADDDYECERTSVKLTLDEISELTYQKFVEMGYTGEGKKDGCLLLRAGHGVVNYLQAEHPGAIEQYLMYCRKSEIIRSTDLSIHSDADACKSELQEAMKPLQSALSNFEEMRKWLSWNTEKGIINYFVNKHLSELSIQLSQEDPSSIQLNKLKEETSAWCENPSTPSDNFSRGAQQDSKISTGFSVAEHQQSDLTL